MSVDKNQLEQFDTLFLSIAQHHPQGASQVKVSLFILTSNLIVFF